MRKDNRDRSTEKFAEDLLDAALSNHHGVEPREGLEDRVLANLRRRPRATRPLSQRLAPVIVAAAVVLSLFAVDHLRRRQAASDPAAGAVSRAEEPHGAVDPAPAAPQTNTDHREVNADGLKLAKAFAAAHSSFRRRGLALNLNSRREGERTESGLRIEEAQISEIRLDEIVIGNNERRE